MKGKNISKLISVFFIIMAMLFSCNTVADEGDVKNTSTEKETTSDLNNKEEQDSGKKDPVTPGDDTTDDVVIPDDDTTSDVVIPDDDATDDVVIPDDDTTSDVVIPDDDTTSDVVISDSTSDRI